MLKRFLRGYACLALTGNTVIGWLMQEWVGLTEAALEHVKGATLLADGQGVESWVVVEIANDRLVH